MDLESRVLLASGDYERGARAPGVVQVAHGVAQTGRHVHVHDADLARGVGIAHGHAEGDVLGQREHVADGRVVGAAVDERQLRAARIAKEKTDLLLLEGVEEEVGALSVCRLDGV